MFVKMAQTRSRDNKMYFQTTSPRQNDRQFDKPFMTSAERLKEKSLVTMFAAKDNNIANSMTSRAAPESCYGGASVTKQN